MRNFRVRARYASGLDRQSNHMRIISNFFLAILLCATICSTGFGQTPAKLENELLGHLAKIEKWSAYGSNSNDELREKENDRLRKKLLGATKSSATLKYGFRALGRKMNISTSEDGNFRIYTWDTESGGTMHNFEAVYQFQTKSGKVFSRTSNLAEGDPGAFVTDVFSVITKTGPVYMACFTSILSTSESFQSIDLFKIEGSQLNDKIKLIKTTSGLQNSLSFEYDFFSVVDRKERPVRLIEYDRTRKTIRLPVVIIDDEFQIGRVTNKFIEYTFNGQYFVKAR